MSITLIVLLVVLVLACAALALATAAGCQLGPMLYGLREYRGEPHRVEPVTIVDDVEFWADPAAGVVHVRSASRVGVKDLGVNRARIEAIRSRLAAIGPVCVFGPNNFPFAFNSIAGGDFAAAI